jgi:histidyl-tRNA synthetase
VYLVLVGAAAEQQGIRLADELRTAVRGLRLETNAGGGSFKSQLKRADKSGARYALIVGDDEAQARTAGLKSLREEEPQTSLPWDQLSRALRERLNRSQELSE